MLKVYDSEKREISRSTMEYPLTSTHDGKNGSSYVFLVYVRNTNVSKYYRNVRLFPRNTTTPSDLTDINGQYSTGFSIKLNYGTVAPLPFEWDLINAGDAVTIPESIGTSTAGDAITFYPIWVRINVPGNTDTQEKTNLALRIEAIEGAVT